MEIDTRAGLWADVVELRRFSWLGVEDEQAIASRRGGEPLAATHSFMVKVGTTMLAPDPIDAVVRARAGRNEPATLDGIAVTRLEVFGVEASLYLAHHIDEVTGLPNPNVPPGETREVGWGHLTLLIELATPIGSPFVPNQAFPHRQGEISFDEALTIARRLGRPVKVGETEETESRWFFRWMMIGSVGGVVEKVGGRLTSFGSGEPWETWVKRYEEGLLDERE